MGLLNILGQVSLDTGQFHAALEAAELSAHGFGKVLKKNLAETIGPLVAIEATREALKSFVEYAEQIHHLSEEIGANTDVTQRWNFAARLSGKEATFVSQIFYRMEKALADATAGSGKMQKALADLGIPLADIRNITADEALRRVGEKLHESGNEAEKTAARIEIFGKSAATVIPILENISRTDLFSKLGLFPSQDQIQNVRLYAEAWGTVGLAIKAAGAKAISPGSLITSSLSALAPGLLLAGRAVGLGGRIDKFLAGQHKPEPGMDRDIIDPEVLEAAKAHMAIQDRIVKMEKEANELDEKTRISKLSDKEKIVEIEREILEIYKAREGFEKDSEAYAKATLDIAKLRLEDQLLLNQENKKENLHPLTNTLRSIGNFLGSANDNGTVDKLDSMDKKLEAIRQNTASQARMGSAFPL